MCKVTPDYQKSVTKVLDYNSAGVNSENHRFIVSLILSFNQFIFTEQPVRRKSSISTNERFLDYSFLPAFQIVYLSLNASSFTVVVT